MKPPIQFQDVQSVLIRAPEEFLASPGEVHTVSIVPHFDRLVVTVDAVEHSILLGNAQQILDELEKGKSVEVTVHVGLPGQEQIFEMKVTWVATLLAGGSKASTVKLLEEMVYRVSGAPLFRGLLEDEADTLQGALVGFADHIVGPMLVSQIVHISNVLERKWQIENWYGL